MPGNGRSDARVVVDSEQASKRGERLKGEKRAAAGKSRSGSESCERWRSEAMIGSRVDYGEGWLACNPGDGVIDGPCRVRLLREWGFGCWECFDINVRWWSMKDGEREGNVCDGPCVFPTICDGRHVGICAFGRHEPLLAFEHLALSYRFARTGHNGVKK